MQRKSNYQVTTAYDFIRNEIITYSLLPETLLSDNQLAKTLGMSRAPIREAILLLQMDGLVQISDDGKVRVSPISFDDISDIFSVRFALESEAIRLISLAGWLTKKQVAELTALHEKLKTSADSYEMSDHYKYDDLFHQRIAGFSNSPRIAEILDRMRLQMQRVRWISIANPNRQLASTDEHQQILDAIVAHDEEAAVAMLKAHFNNSLKSFQDVLNDKKMQALSLVINSFCTSHKD